MIEPKIRRWLAVGLPATAMPVLVRTLGEGVVPVRVGSGRRDPHLVATPEALVQAFAQATELVARLPEDHGLVVPDAAFAGALLTLLDAVGDRRSTVVLAGMSTALRWLATSGSLPLHGEAGAVVDWELVAYRLAGSVLATSPNARDLLAHHLGVTSFGAPFVQGVAVAPSAAVTHVELGDPPGRPSLPDLARWLGGSPVTTVAVAEVDRRDEVYQGATAEVAAPWPAGVRTVAARRREKPDAVIASDPLAWPSERTRHLVARGVPLVARGGSPTAQAFRGAATFDDAQSLASAMHGVPAMRSEPVDLPEFTPREELPPKTARARAVSAIVPVYRDVRWLEDCVSSLLAQTEPLHEILLVDDGSDDPTVTAALEAQRERAPDQVRLLAQPNGGVCRARNVALDQVTGDAVLMVDSDDELEPTFVERTATVLRNRPELVAVATWTRFFGTYEGVEAKPPFDARVGRRENPIVSTCVLLDRAVIDAGVRFVPELADVYCEDWEVWAHIVALGGRFGLVPEPLVRHRVHPSSGGHHRTDLALDLGRERATSWLRAAPATGPLSR